MSAPNSQRWKRAFRAQRREAEALAADLSPAAFNRFVRLTAGGWLEGTCVHQRRHLRQARQVREAIA